ncbi:MAG: hypothetical protein JWP88_1792, partial [Flaviaesturariibacter sp.]|nr:hypothetical protein [Flaviaesturariibacter sp.]
MKKVLLFIAFLFCLTQLVSAQKIASADLRQLRHKEDSLKTLAEDLTLDSLTAGRMRSDSQFVRTLVRSLQIKNSFYYPFDSLFGVSKLYSPDSTFRIFTWLMNFDGFYSRQRGAIQMRTPDG